MEIIKYFFIIIILLFITLFFYIINYKEHFSIGHGTGFARFYKPIPKCTPANNCFKGSYHHSKIYQNICEPDSNLLKQKRNLIDRNIKFIR
jgi:hypothetical protein